MADPEGCLTHQLQTGGSGFRSSLLLLKRKNVDLVLDKTFNNHMIMKKAVQITILVLAMHIVAFSQTCLPDGITFSSQNQINNFQSDYPGCTEIIGDVYIVGSNIQNLDGLNVLTALPSMLSIGYYNQGNPMLSSIQGLENLTELGALAIRNNVTLASLSGLQGISNTASIIIEDNASLTNLTGLDGLTYITYLNLRNNYSLANLHGLEKLDSTSQHISIIDNPSLASLDGLHKLKHIGVEGLTINNNDALTSIEALQGVNYAYSITIDHNESIQSLEGLDNIAAESLLYIEIIDNAYLSTCEVQSICDYLAMPDADVFIAYNSVGCNNPEEVEAACEIAALTCFPEGVTFSTQISVNGFHANYPQCIKIGGDMVVTGNSITNLDGLNQLLHVEGSLSIENNNSLTNLSGLNNIDTIGGNLSIENANGLQNLSGLSGLNSLGGMLKLSSNESLKSIIGIEGVLALGGNLVITDNIALETLHGLEAIGHIAGTLEIQNNPLLISLDGLDSIRAETISSITIKNNALLSECHIKSVCDYLSNPTGTVEIENNALGCNSTEEVEQACLLTVRNMENTSTIRLYPNPANQELYFKYSQNQAIKEINIYNKLGVRVMKVTNPTNPLNISPLETGLYIVDLISYNGRFKDKIIVY